MTLTLQQIWERYSDIDFVRKVEIKRLSSDGVTYETNWSNIEDLVGRKVNTMDVCQDIKLEIPNDTYAFGNVTLDNASLLFENPYGNVSDEGNSNSIFSGFIRHKSLLRIMDGYVDKYTNPNNPVLVTAETFQGMIDDKQCATTFDDQEKMVVTNLLVTLLQQFNKGDLALSGTNTTNNWVYAIMNRSPFTSFFTVSAVNIAAGVNTTTFDMDQYSSDTSILEILQDLSKGHSIFFVKNGVFYFKEYAATPTVILDLGLSPERKSKFQDYDSGAKRVRDKWYWENTNLQYPPVMTGLIYNETETVNIKGITQNTDRQNWLNYVGAKLTVKRPTFKLTIPFNPTLSILDRITLTRVGQAPVEAFRFDVGQFDVNRMIDPVGAILMNNSINWLIRGIKYTKKLETVLTLEMIV